jgi:hypothetical protein
MKQPIAANEQHCAKRNQPSGGGKILRRKGSFPMYRANCCKVRNELIRRISAAKNTCRRGQCADRPRKSLRENDQLPQ